MERRRVALQNSALGLVPEQVLVIETVGPIENFVRAVETIEGLEWLAEHELDALPPAYGFEDRSRPDKPLRGQLFLVITDQQALAQLRTLFDRWRRDTTISFPRRLAPWKHAFTLMHNIRPWNSSDRIRGTGVIEDWQFRLDHDPREVPFEAEFWFRRNAVRRRDAEAELVGVVNSLQGTVVGQCVIPAIAYHAILARLPPASIQEVIDRLADSRNVELLECDGIMHFRPVGQCAVPLSDATDANLMGEDDAPPVVEQSPVAAPPLVALLDGLPLTAHRMLANRLIVDDPDVYEADYLAHERVHGTEMASLICHGDVGDTSKDPRESGGIRPLYVRPIAKPGRQFGRSFPERIPEDVLPVDLIHRSVRRLFESEGDQPPAAPTVRIVNLSLGDPDRPFVLEVSAWARLLDWLAWKYQVLFVVSAGNHTHDITLQTTPRSLSDLTPEQREAEVLRSVAADTRNRRLLSPAETLNGLTIGALHQDEWVGPSGHVDPFAGPGLPNVLSAHGPGYRRAIKPDSLFPGGRQWLSEKPRSDGGGIALEIPLLASPPGQRVATPGGPGQLDRIRHTRGTSNAAALASRGAGMLYGAIEDLGRGPGVHIPQDYHVVLTKALLVHGAAWETSLQRYEAALKTRDNRRAFRDYVARFLGYGAVSPARVTRCAEERVTVIGFGKLDDGEGHLFSLPLPPCLSGAGETRRLTVTLAWLSPVNPSHRSYRVAHLWFDPKNAIAPQRLFADHRAVQRGTVQHEVLEGQGATVFQDGDALGIQVNCRADAGDVPAPIPYGLAISLEVVQGTQLSLTPLPVYNEVRERLAVRVPVHPRDGSATAP